MRSFLADAKPGDLFYRSSRNQQRAVELITQSGVLRRHASSLRAVARSVRRGLVIIAGGSDADGDVQGETQAFRERVRQMLFNGDLPRSNGQLWAGKGSGRPCSICGNTIEPTAMEYEVDGERPIVVHQECHAIWATEAARISQPMQGAGPDRSATT